MNIFTETMGKSQINSIIYIALSFFIFAGLTSTAKAQDPDFHIYLGIGQSNMEGGPKVNGLPEVDPRFQVMSVVDCPRLSPPRTMGKWYPANPPLPRCDAGPGIVDWCGRTLIDSLPSNIKIGVIMVTIVGTKIEVFDKDGYQDYLNDPSTADWLRNIAREYDSNPYGRLIELAKLAQEDGVIKGILVHQGESNAGDNQWPDKVKKIYDDIISDLSLDPKDIPLLAGEVVNADMNGAAAGANQHINRLPSVLPNSYVISSSKIPAGGDNMHFTAEGHKIFGQRYADTLLSIMNQTTDVYSPASSSPGFALGVARSGPGPKLAEIKFTLPERAFVSLKVYTLEGKEITELAGMEFPSGQNSILLNRKRTSGLQILRMKTEGFSATRMFMNY